MVSRRVLRDLLTSLVHPGERHQLSGFILCVSPRHRVGTSVRIRWFSSVIIDHIIIFMVLDSRIFSLDANNNSRHFSSSLLLLV